MIMALRLAAFSIGALIFAGPSHARSATGDPLPAWSDAATRQAVIEFVDRVTRTGPDFAAPGERVAVFDDEGAVRGAYAPQRGLSAYLYSAGFRTVLRGDAENVQVMDRAGRRHAMLQYTNGREGPGLAMLIHHDGASRRYVDDGASLVGE